MFDGEMGMKSVYYERGGRVPGYLDDYAFYVEACLALASKIDWVGIGNLSGKYVERAREVMEMVLKNFKDDPASGFFFSSKDNDALITRKKYWWDQAIPSGNGSLVHCFSELYALTGEASYAENLEKLRKSFTIFAQKAPSGVAYALSGFVQDDVGIAVLKIGGPVGEMERIQGFLSKRDFRKVFILVDEKVKEKTYQLCIGTQCFEYSSNIEDVLKKLNL